MRHDAAKADDIEVSRLTGPNTLTPTVWITQDDILFRDKVWTKITLHYVSVNSYPRVCGAWWTGLPKAYHPSDPPSQPFQAQKWLHVASCKTHSSKYIAEQQTSRISIRYALCMGRTPRETGLRPCSSRVLKCPVFGCPMNIFYSSIFSRQYKILAAAYTSHQSFSTSPRKKFEFLTFVAIRSSPVSQSESVSGQPNFEVFPHLTVALIVCLFLALALLSLQVLLSFNHSTRKMGCVQAA